MALVYLGSFVTPSMAQTTSTPANPQNPSTQSLQAGVDTAASAVAPTPGSVSLGVAGASAPGINTIASSNRPGSLRSAGRGLPGMAGGLPIKGPMGAQDPASRYMQPRTIGPLFCDPLLEGLCD